jgi:hypothetical protein
MDSTDTPRQRTAQDRRRNLVRGRTRIKASSYLPERDRKPSYDRVNRWRLRNPERQRALSAVASALQKYDLDKGPCERCGTDKNVCADEITLHPKLGVVWRCRCCAIVRRREKET